MDDKKLIEELRRRGLGNGTSLGQHSGLCDAAADRIEALTIQLAASERQREAEMEEVKRCGTRLIEFGESGARAVICPECGFPVADYGVNKDIYCSWCKAKSTSTIFSPSGPGYCTTSLDRKSKVLDKLLLRERGPQEAGEVGG